MPRRGFTERIIDSCLKLIRDGIDGKIATAPMVRYCSFI